MNLILANDNKTAKDIETLAPHKNMFDLNNPRALSNVASIPKPVISTISNWMHYDMSTDTVDLNKQKFMESIAIH
jgi:hypothetical protein